MSKCLKTWLIPILLVSLVFSLGVNSAYAVAAPKKTIAVSDFENKSGFAGEWNMGQGMADMLTDSLMQSGQFTVLERQALDAVLAEQNLAASGRATKVGGAKMGDIKRAQILIQGAVTEFETNTQGGGQGLSFGGFSVGAKSSEAHVAVIIRLIDSTTGQVINSKRVEGKAKAGGLSFGASVSGVGFNQSGFKKTPVGKACQIAIDNAVAFIASEAASIPWKGRIIKVDDKGTVYVNAGSEGGLKKGITLTVERPGEELLDPETGMSLGGENETIGTIKIDNVQKKFSKAEVVDGSTPQAGDILIAA